MQRVRRPPQRDAAAATAAAAAATAASAAAADEPGVDLVWSAVLGAEAHEVRAVTVVVRGRLGVVDSGA